jgi:hypothetical protein
MEDLFNSFDSLPELEDTVDLDQVSVPEDDFFTQEGSIDDPIYPTYGEVKDIEWPSYTFRTPGGKTIEVYHNKMGTLWGVRFKEGGQLPAELSGQFTSDSEAVKQVELYLARQ